MKKALSIVLLTLILLSISLAKAQPQPPDVSTLGPELIIIGDKGCNVKIISPVNQANYSGEIKLTIIVEAVGLLGQFGNVGYSVDGGTIYSIRNMAKSVDETGYPEKYWYKTTATASLSLPILTDGFHTITVYYGWQYQYLSPYLEVHAYSTVDFSIGNSNATPEIYIRSPADQSFTQTNFTILSFYLEQVHTGAKEASIYYSLDGKNYSISNFDELGIKTVIDNVVPFNQKIANLTDGVHSLTVFAQVYYLHNWLFEGNSSIQFTVDSSSPAITEVSVANITYASQNIALSFCLNEPASWIAYNLDNQGNVTLQGNTTLTKLSVGSHSLVIYANDTLGNMAKTETVFFEVKAKEDFTLAFVLIGAIALTFAGLLIYFKKYHKISSS